MEAKGYSRPANNPPMRGIIGCFGILASVLGNLTTPAWECKWGLGNLIHKAQQLGPLRKFGMNTAEEEFHSDHGLHVASVALVLRQQRISTVE
jgi:hypothetical protein